MRYIFHIFLLFLFSILYSSRCIENIEVNLWGQCYSINETFKLNVSGSGLTGSIPVEIGQLTNLYSIDLSNNRLSGEIPAEIGNLHKLDFLYLQDNELSGEIPLSLIHI